jgi:threonine dehydrogenase-like Zn-dependent dehydrogenase
LTSTVDPGRLPATYLAAALDAGSVELVTLPLREPGPGELLVKVRACALCTWEVRTYTGTERASRPLLGGHEIAGEVVAVGPGVIGAVQVGDRVAVRRMAACGACRGCHEGGQCRARAAAVVDTGVYWGPQGLAEYLTIPAYQAFPVGRLDFAVAALVEPLSCVLRSVDRAGLEFGDDALVFGAGFMGILHARIARLRGARVLLVEPDAARRHLARDVTAGTFDPAESGFVDQVRDLTDGGPSAVFVTGGGGAALRAGLEAVAERGRVVVFAASYPPEELPVAPNWLHHKEVALVGAVGQSAAEFRRAVLLVARGVLDPGDLISAVYPLAEVESAIRYASDGATYRVVVTMNGP